MGHLEFKIDVLAELKKKGYNTTRLREDHLLSQGTLTRMRKGIVPQAMMLTLCELLDKQPGSIIRYVPDNPAEESAE